MKKIKIAVMLFCAATVICIKWRPEWFGCNEKKCSKYFQTIGKRCSI